MRSRDPPATPKFMKAKKKMRLQKPDSPSVGRWMKMIKIKCLPARGKNSPVEAHADELPTLNRKAERSNRSSGTSSYSIFV